MFSIKQSTMKMDAVVLLGLFTFFTAVAVTVVIFGANQFKLNTDKMYANSSERNISSYIVEKSRQHNDASAVTLEEVDQTQVLKFTTETEDASYITFIYEQNGWVCELTVLPDTVFSLSAGQKLFEVEDWTMSMQKENLLRISYTNVWKHSQDIYIDLLSK